MTYPSPSQKVAFYVVTGVALVSVLAACLIFYTGFKHDQKLRAERRLDNRQSLTTICNGLNSVRVDIRDFIVASIRKSDTLLPQLSYYKLHPDELANAHAANLAAIKATQEKFAPKPCAIPAP